MARKVWNPRCLSRLGRMRMERMAAGVVQRTKRITMLMRTITSIRSSGLLSDFRREIREPWRSRTGRFCKSWTSDNLWKQNWKCQNSSTKQSEKWKNSITSHSQRPINNVMSQLTILFLITLENFAIFPVQYKWVYLCSRWQFSFFSPIPRPLVSVSLSHLGCLRASGNGWGSIHVLR